MATPRIKRGQRYRQLLHLNPCAFSLCLLTTRVTKTTRATLAFIKRVNHFKLCTHHWHQHQLRNAKILEKAGAAIIVSDDCNTESTADSLTDALKKCLYDVRSKQMAQAALDMGKPDAAERVAQEIWKMGGA